MPETNVPHFLLVEFLKASGDPVRLADLGSGFMVGLGLPPGNSPRPFQVTVERKTSRAGNYFYEYSQNGVPFPDGLDTLARVGGVVVPMGRMHLSKSKNPTREGNAEIAVASIPYVVTVYITENRSPYWVKVVAHVKPRRTARLTAPQRAPRGGQIVIA